MKNLTLITILSLLLVSCGITKRDIEIKPAVTVSENYLETASQHSVFTKTNTQTVVNWWSEFNDPILDTLIQKARKHNLDITTAVANFHASRALVKDVKLDRLPTVTANGNVTRTRLGENIFVSGTNPTFTTYNGSFDAFWETDLFGRVSNRIKGAAANQQLALNNLQDVYVSIFAEVSRNYIELRGAQYQLDIANRNLDGQQETYHLTVRLLEAGTSNQLDVSRAQAQLENTRATIPPLKARIEALKNSISVLIGEVPGSLGTDIITKQPLPSLPETVSIGNVTDLLRRRPDVKRVEAELQVQIAQYNLSVAELYPKIQFGGSIGFSAVDFSNFASKESFTWSVFPSISWAAFNLGSVKQQIRKEDALTLATLQQYEKTVLKALEEIRTAMTNYTNELERREILRKSSLASAEAAEIARKRFNAGLDSFIDYLSADNTLLLAENRLATSEIASATSLIAIYKALGGGWEIISGAELDEQFEAIKLAESR
ncbi:efflux transporter outer membrane subunit [Aquimarina litoralis]|uniref:efflux transporter outer membrane subunit n=1 Tax=Aquimarina litoralis TaxID=584605 RepID=UPI001C55FEFF|nr:TolC family protein [Aquimarina litoralis]MBW1296023.1 efflux transporter outer membrane subunit [Aquimarina litoralis]